MSDLIRPGDAPHYCDYPRLDITIRNGAIWRCPGCRRQWILRSRQISRHSWEGTWKRAWWRFW